MNKKLNKLVTNYPVELNEEEIENLSATLAPVIAACGGGGGTGGKIYTGTGFVNVNNTTNQIGLTEDVNDKLNKEYVEYNEYSTAIANRYTKTQTNALLDKKQDTLEFEYDENNKVSAINGSALASQGGGDVNYSAGIDLKIENNIISVDTNGNPNNTASNTRNFVEGSWTVASGYNSHAEGMATTAYGYAVHAQGMWTKFSSSKWSDNDHPPIDIYWAAGAGATVEGYCNATTSCPMSGTEGKSDYGPIHGGILKVIGNGNVVHYTSVDPDAHIHELHPSDALIIFKDGCISAAGNISANGVKLGGGTTLTLPINVGTGNDVSQTSAIGAIGNNCSAGTKSFAFSYKGATAANNSFAVNDDNVADHNSFAWGWANTADNYSMAGGNATSADEHSFALGNAVYTKYWTLGIGRGLEFNGDSNANTGIGALVAGGWNKTSSNAIFVLGNGTGNGSNRSDAVVVDRSGNTKIYGSLTVDVSSGKNVLAVASAATLIGASRQTSSHYGVDNTALGTTWVGVASNGMHQGFIKYTDGGDVGALDTTSTIQINIKPESAGLNGEMTITNVNGATTANSKVVNVPTASYNNMSSFDNTNGPNYMLRKTASGFDIGAAVINVTSLPQQTEANAYYFVYDV